MSGWDLAALAVVASALGLARLRRGLLGLFVAWLGQAEPRGRLTRTARLRREAEGREP